MATSRKGVGVIDISGKRYGRLLVLGLCDDSGNYSHAHWLCKCDCGNTHAAAGTKLRSGEILSCGCYRKDNTTALMTRHGHSKRGNVSKTYMVWQSMINRCNRPTSKDFKYYGARGIQVCVRWTDSFELFLLDMGEKPDGLSIDRVNNDGNYEPSNCRWATATEQQANSRRK